MNTPIMPPAIAPPVANYAHAVLSVDVTRLLHTSGVVPVRPDGSVPVETREQAVVVWTNIQAMLEDADMSVSDIVSVTTYVVVGESLAEVMEVRDRVFGGHIAASTLLPVAALARPEWNLEIAIVAAR